MSSDTLTVLTVVLAVVVIAVLAVALGTLRSALEDVESQHLRPLECAVKAINAQFDVILSALPGIARKAAIVAERRPR